LEAEINYWIGKAMEWEVFGAERDKKGLVSKKGVTEPRLAAKKSFL